MLGNVVNNLVNANQSSGYKSVQWNATDNLGQPVSAGVYLYSIETKDFRKTKKMILLKQKFLYALSPTLVGFFVYKMVQFSLQIYWSVLVG